MFILNHDYLPYLLGDYHINKIIKHILYRNKHVVVDTLDQNDLRKFLIFLRPRLKENVQYPYSTFCYEYYDEMEKLKTKSQ